jgi:hypothetical protein
MPFPCTRFTIFANAIFAIVFRFYFFLFIPPQQLQKIKLWPIMLKIKLKIFSCSII